jgi:hypothetical protein
MGLATLGDLGTSKIYLSSKLPMTTTEYVLEKERGYREAGRKL